MSLKEIEYFGESQKGRLRDRLAALIDRLLIPLEEEWLGSAKDGPVVPRVKNLRTAILPDMVKGNVDAKERTRRWRHLADIYLAQQVSCYPPDYLIERPSVTRILEIVERLEEDLTDKVRAHGNLKAILEVGEAIAVDTTRDRSAEVDPLMARIGDDLQAMLDRLALESPIYEPGSELFNGSFQVRRIAGGRLPVQKFEQSRNRSATTGGGKLVGQPGREDASPNPIMIGQCQKS